ncbi:hypothetical protein H5090_13325 [Pseudoalteromonas sp. SR43-5]|nr:hypothetical protein [Pseudoalteromonas sp. SR43-5]
MMPEFSHECFLAARKKTRFSKITQQIVSGQLEERKAEIYSANEYELSDYFLDLILPHDFGSRSCTTWCDKNNSWFVGAYGKIACIKNDQLCWVAEIDVAEDDIWCSTVNEIVILPSGKLMVTCEANQLRLRKALVAIFETNGDIVNYFIAAQYNQVNILKSFALDNNTVLLFSSVDYPKVSHLTLEAWEITHDENWDNVSLNAIRCRTPIAICSASNITNINSDYYLFGDAYLDDTRQDILVKWEPEKHDFTQVSIFELEWKSDPDSHFLIEVDGTKLLMLSTAKETVNEHKLIAKLWDKNEQNLMWQVSYVLPKPSMEILSFKRINEQSAIACLKDKCYPANNIYYCKLDMHSGQIETVLELDSDGS